MKTEWERVKRGETFFIVTKWTSFVAVVLSLVAQVFINNHYLPLIALAVAGAVGLALTTRLPARVSGSVTEGTP